MEWPDKIIVNGTTFVYFASPISEGATEELIQLAKSEGRRTYVMLYKTKRGTKVFVVYADIVARGQVRFEEGKHKGEVRTVPANYYRTKRERGLR